MESHSYPAGQIPSIPTHSSSSTTLKCCCGRNDCAFLDHNNAALEGLEKDLATAARLGQALLHRHETYMAEAEEDRHRLLASIESLERERREVQAENARIIEENRELLEQLEGLNKAVAESDSYVKTLTLTLESTQQELRKLTVSAARAVELEAQLNVMEAEQTKLQERLFTAREDERSAVQRWKKAECTLRDLHDQVDRIEREAHEEKERHAELVQRMERRRIVERELDGAAGRLKGAAAASELGRNQGGTNVVSRFVRDILQDNATLQMGIMELREMLETSNQEVQSLREQILSHQPVAVPSDDVEAEPQPSTTLSEELDKQSRRMSQELHIHHHYHTPSLSGSSKKDKTPLHRRTKKRRCVLGSPAMLHSASGTQLARKSIHNHRSSTSSASTILSQTSVSIPSASSHRWSLQSPAADSLASSPQSAYRSSSIFDRMDHGFESSQPTSPESTIFSSPLMEARHRKGSFDAPFRSLPAPEGFDHPLDDDLLAVEDDHFAEHKDGTEIADGLPIHPAIPEESEDSSSQGFTGSDPEYGNHPPADEDVFTMQFHHSLRKSTSHESLFSIAGMDIHTPRNRPSRMSELHSAMPIRLPRRIVSPSVELVSTPPIISTTTIMADRVSLPRRSEQSSQSLLASVAANSNVPTDSSSIASHESVSTESTATSSKAATLGRRVGGWVLGRWGVAPVASNGDLRSQAVTDITAASSVPTTSVLAASASNKLDKPKPQAKSPAFVFRSPGVNQKGPIFGLRPPPRAPVSIHAEGINESLLRESLAE